jgi:hypothetical protein
VDIIFRLFLIFISLLSLSRITILSPILIINFSVILIFNIGIHKSHLSPSKLNPLQYIIPSKSDHIFKTFKCGFKKTIYQVSFLNFSFAAFKKIKTFLFTYFMMNETFSGIHFESLESPSKNIFNLYKIHIKIE